MYTDNNSRPVFVASDEGNYWVKEDYKNGRNRNQLSQKQLVRREISATKSRKYVILMG